MTTGISGKTTPARRGWAKLGGASVAAALGMLALALGITGLLLWSTRSVDGLAREQQLHLADKVLLQSTRQIAQAQESVTMWDDSVVQVRKTPLDFDWLDNNLGVWLYSFYGHDSAHVLDPENRPIYSMIDGARRPPHEFESIATQLEPLVAELRSKMNNPGSDELPASELSVGVTDMLVLDGHPSIVSVKPIISETGLIEQAPGTEFVHVVVRRLDGSFVGEVRRDYGFSQARFVAAGARLRSDENARPLLSRSGRVIGYFAWRPFAPGSQVFARLAPVLLVALLLVGMLVLLLMHRVAHRTRELQESDAKVRHLVFHDALTQLPNRALFEDRLDHALQVFRRTANHRLALLFLDLDRFKAVNDTLGHAAGDQLLREFGRRLALTIGASDTAARLGGDEFAIIQRDVSSLEDTADLCRRIIEAAAKPFTLGTSQVHVGVSIGVALAGKDGLDPEELARRADIALYEVKATGRGQYSLFSPAMDEPIRARQNADKDLRAALEAGDQLSIVYQPIYAAANGEIVGVEALVRWRHPQLGELSPTLFIPIAEETGLIEPLGDWILERACRDARDWPIATLSINVSPIQLRNPHFATRAIAILSETGIEASRVEFELTETAMVADTGQCAVNLRLLREFGVRVALDDFGTGYSSFSHFNKFEVDRVKIDRTFVDKIDVGEGGSAIIQAIVELARSSGFRTTAEGVETEQQRAFLQRIGCDEMQGFLLARPIPPGEIDALLGATARSTNALRRSAAA